MRLALHLLFLAAPLAAQDRVIAAISQVGEGDLDSLILEINAEDPSLLDILVVTRSDYSWSSPTETVRYEGAFFLGPNNAPELHLGDLGTVQLQGLGCFICGRHHFGQSFVLQDIDDVWTVTGYSEHIVDRLAPWRAGTCEVDLVTGHTDIQLAEEPWQRVDTTDRSIPLPALAEGYSPGICDRIHLSEENWEPYKPADWEE